MEDLKAQKTADVICERLLRKVCLLILTKIKQFRQVEISQKPYALRFADSRIRIASSTIIPLTASRGQIVCAVTYPWNVSFCVTQTPLCFVYVLYGLFVIYASETTAIISQ